MICNNVGLPSASHVQRPRGAVCMNRGVAGKRKLVSGGTADFSNAAATAGSMLVNCAPQFTNFGAEKRQCRPAATVHNQEHNYTGKTGSGTCLSITLSRSQNSALLFRSVLVGW